MSGFTKAPSNPYSDKVNDALQQQAVETEQQVATPQPVVTQPVATPQPATVQQPQPQPAVVQQPPVNVQQTQSQPVVDPYEYNRLLEANRQLVSELQHRDKAIEHLSADAKELNDYRQAVRLNEVLASQNFDEFSSLDPEDARALTANILKATNSMVEPIKAGIEEQRNLLAQSNQQHEERQRSDKLMRAVQEISIAHPDFNTLQHTPEYLAFMAGHDGYSSKTRDQVAAEELSLGNTKYVIDLLHRMKGTQPQVDNIISVAPIQSATVAATATTQPTSYTVKELNDLYQTRSITYDRYKDLLQQARQQAV